jgi:germination protein M
MRVRFSRDMKKIFVLVLCLLAASLVVGCGLMQKLGFKSSEDDNDEICPASSILLTEEEASKLTDKLAVHLYFSNSDNSKLMKEIRYIPLKEAKDTTNLASVIVKELVKGPSDGTGFKATIPEGARLRSPVSIDAGIATVDFTKEFIDKHPGEKEAETATIFSIVNSLTELKDIQKVRFTIDGKTLKEFKGAFRFDAPFPRNSALISNESSVTVFTEIVEESEDVSGQAGENISDETAVPVEGGLDEPYIEILE